MSEEQTTKMEKKPPTSKSSLLAALSSPWPLALSTAAIRTGWRFTAPACKAWITERGWLLPAPAPGPPPIRGAQLNAVADVATSATNVPTAILCLTGPRRPGIPRPWIQKSHLCICECICACVYVRMRMCMYGMLVRVRVCMTIYLCWNLCLNVCLFVCSWMIVR